MSMLLNINELEEGMVIGQDIVNKHTGVVLVAKKTRMTREIIEKLGKHEIRYI